MQIIKGARGGITTTFGEDIGRGFLHRGIDIGHGNKTADDLLVVAPAAGEIIAAGWDGTYGNRVIIDHGHGWTSIEAHLARINQWSGRTELGAPVGIMGDTGGDWPVHLHQELRRYGIPIDPLLYLGSNPAGGTLTPLGDDMPSEAWLNGLGKAIIDQTSAKLTKQIAELRADVNYIHQVGPYSLKAIRTAQQGGQPITLSPEQVDALSTQLVAAVTSGLGSALEEDQQAVLDAITALPAATRAEIARALVE